MADRNPAYQCYTYDSIIKMGGQIVHNIDGSVSVYMLNNFGVLAPVILTQECCSVLGLELTNDDPQRDYFFDVDKQKCLWKKPVSACSLNDIFKVVLNPNGDDGALFYKDANQTCFLNVDFDYLFKVNCSTLSSMIKRRGGSIEEPFAISTQSVEKSDEETNLSIQIEEQENICLSHQYELDEINKLILDTPYSIECKSSQPTQPTSVSSVSIEPSFSKSAFGGNSAISPFSFDLSTNTIGTFCLTESKGLEAWSKILGLLKYQAFLNGDSNSYTCEDVQKIVDENTNTLLGGGSALIYECNIPFGYKTELLNKQSEILKNIETCNTILSELTDALNQLSPISVEASIGESQTVKCGSPIDFFESLNVTMTVDVITSANTIETVYEEQLFGPIGEGNLYNYLVTAATNSGFYVCGDPNETETNFNSCTPMLFELEGSSVENVTACQTVMGNILRDLYEESGLADPIIFNDSLSVSALTSNWLHFNTTITDLDVLTLIENKKIKISFKIKSTCGSFCILVDNISLNKVCSEVKETNLFISQPPSFNLERIHDNKKSWVKNTIPVNRSFDMKNSFGVKPIRQTNYDVNDERLVVNSKEIDLDINIAAGIETDVWCYIIDNPCILTGITNCNPCSYLCCGDNLIPFDELLSTDLSEVTTLESFKEVLISELIDVKNRQTISSYPTLKALYERYINSTKFCDTNSSAFNYMTMDQFAGLIDTYWVDIVEQVIPATTIWGSVKIYTNTLFDQQKYKYKAYTSLLCGNPYSGKTISSPINGTTGQCTSVEVIATNVILNNQPNVRIKQVNYTCDSLCVAQMNMGSEFIGTVTINRISNE